jgi:hypothetical protein
LNSSSDGSLRASRARGVLVSLIAIGAIGVVFLGTAGSASASKANCTGQLGPSVESPKSKSDLSYSFSCDQNILAYTLTFTKQIILFGPEVLPTLPSGEASGELVSCEGDIPSSGIGCTAQSSVCPSQAAYTSCTGKVAAGNTIKSEVETFEPYCPKQKRKDIKKGKKPKKPISASLIVSSIEFTASGKTFVNSSLPFTLTKAFKCPKPKK